MSVVNIKVEGNLKGINQSKLAAIIEEKIKNDPELKEALKSKPLPAVERVRKFDEAINAGEKLIYQLRKARNQIATLKPSAKKLKKKSIFERAVETFGINSQLDQAQEEASELITAVSKYKKALETKDENIIECRKADVLLELADLHIMSKQLRIILGYEIEDLKQAVKVKSQKLEKHLENAVKLH